MHLLRTKIACGTAAGAGTAYIEQVTCPECLSHRDPFPLIRRFAELIGPVPQGFTFIPEREWLQQAAKIEEEIRELCNEIDDGPPTTIDAVIRLLVEMMDVTLSCAVLCEQYGVSSQRALALVARYAHLRAAHGMEGGEFVHSEAVKGQLRDEMFAEFTSVIWRGR